MLLTCYLLLTHAGGVRGRGRGRRDAQAHATSPAAFAATPASRVATPTPRTPRAYNPRNWAINVTSVLFRTVCSLQVHYGFSEEA